MINDCKAMWDNLGIPFLYWFIFNNLFSHEKMRCSTVWPVLNNKISIEGYNLRRKDRSRKGGAATCFINQSVANSYETNMRLNTESIFTENYLPKSKPFRAGII